MVEGAGPDWQSDMGTSQKLGAVAPKGWELAISLNRIIFLLLEKVGTHVSTAPGVTSTRSSF